MAKRANKKLVAGLTVTGMIGLTAVAFAMLQYLPGKDPQSWVDRATRLTDQGHYQDAMRCYQKAAGLAKVGGRPLAEVSRYRILAGDMAMKSGNARFAERFWRDVTLNDPDNAEAQERIVKLYLEYADMAGGPNWPSLQKEASALLNITGQEKNNTGLHALGRALVQQKAVNEEYLELGKEKLIEAFNGDKSNPDYAKSLAGLYYMEKDNLKRELEEAVSQAEKDRIQAKMDNLVEEAIHVYEVLLDPANQSNDPEKLAACYRNRGQFNLDIKKNAIQRLRQAESDSSPQRELAALREEIESADKQAIDDFKEAVDIDPSNVESLVALGQYWREKESTAKSAAESVSEKEGFRLKAIEQYKKAIETDPDSYLGYLNLSRLYFSDQEYDEALQVLQARMERGIRKEHYLGWRNEAYMRSVRNEAFRTNLAMWMRMGQQLQDKKEIEAKRAEIMQRLESLYDRSVAESASREKDSSALFMKGRIEYLRNNKREAIEYMRQADEQAGGNNTEIKQLLASLYIETGSPGAATEHLQAILNMFPNSEVTLAALAEVYVRTEQPRRAIQEAEKVLRINPNNKQVLNTMVKAYRQLGDMGTVGRLLERLEKMSGKEGGDTQKLRRALALQLQATQEDPPSASLLKEAEQLLREILSDHPFDAYTLQRLVAVMEDGNEPTEEINRLLDKSKAHAQEQLTVVRADGDDAKVKRIGAFLQTIDLLRILADKDTTKEEKDRRIKELIESGTDDYAKALSLFQLYRHTEGMENEALAQLKRAFELKPDDPSLIQIAFQYALNRQEWDFTEQLVDKGIELDVDGGKGHFFKGRFLLAKGEAAQAVKEFRAGLTENPSYSSGHLFLGDSLMLLGHYDEAEYEYKEAQRLNPANNAVLVGLAMLATARNDQEARRTYLDQCAKRIPNNPWVRLQLQSEEDRRDPQKGIARRVQDRQVRPDDIGNLMQLAGLYTEQHQYDQAQEVYEDVLKRDPLNIQTVRTYVRFLHRKQPPDPQRAGTVIHETIDKIDPSDTGAKAKAQLLLAEHLKIQAAGGRPGAPTRDDVDKAYLAAYEISPTPSTGISVGLYYASTNRPKEAEEWYRQSMSQAEAQEQVEIQRRVRILLVELMLRYRPNERLDRVQKEIDEYRQLYPDDKRAMLFQGELYGATNRQAKAIEQFTQFIKEGGDPPLGHYRRGHAYFRQGRWDAAIKDLEEVKRLSPAFSGYQARLLLANTYTSRGNDQQARAELESILVSNPDLPQVVEELFKLYMGTDPPMLASAERLLRPRLEAEPNNYLWPLLLANVPGIQGEAKEAVQLAKRAVELGGKHKRTVAGLLNIYLYFNRFDDIITFMTESFKEAKSSADVHMIVARAYSGKKDYRHAIEQSVQAFQAEDARFDAIFKYFVNYVAPKPTLDSLLEILDERLSANPVDAAAMFFRAAVLYQKGELDRFIEQVTKLADHPFKDDRIERQLQPFLTRQLAEAYSKTKAYPKAVELYEKLLETNPDDTFALNNLATILMDNMNKPEAALPYSKRVAELTPQNYFVMDTLGWNQVLVGDLDAGIASLLKAIEGVSHIATLHYHIAEAYQRRSQDPNAHNPRGDRMDAESSCRQAHKIVMNAGTDDEGVFDQILDLGKRLGLELDDKLPGARAANKP